MNHSLTRNKVYAQARTLSIEEHGGRACVVGRDVMRHFKLPSMTILNLILVALSFVCLNLSAFCQQVTFSAEQSYAMHDSIAKSRWDWGGIISDYSFRHMSEFFPVAVIENPEQSRPLYSFPLNYISQIKVKPANDSTQLNDSISLEKYLHNIHLNGIIILYRDSILFEKYYGMLPGELHTLQSVSKVITSTIIAQLENQKKIDLTNPVEKYLPELEGTDWQSISVENILDMRSGIEGAEVIPGTHPFTDPKNLHYQFEAALGVVPKTDSTFSSVYKYISTLKRARNQGEKAEYNSINTFVLGWIAERITGKKYADLVSEMIWKPMGAYSTAYVCLSDKGVACSNAGISTTLRDLARFGMLFTKSDVQQRKEKIISFSQVNKIQQIGELGYQWEWAEKGGGMMKTGFGGQGIYVNPQKNIVIAFFNYVNDDWKDVKMLPVLQQIEKVILTKEKY